VHDATLSKNDMLQGDLLRRTLDMQNMLNHVDEGFLIVDETLKVLPEYSGRCVDILLRDSRGA
jgi:hypothetical protein